MNAIVERVFYFSHAVKPSRIPAYQLLKNIFKIHADLRSLIYRT